MMIVSIPNGMEFYPFSARLWLEIHCFNSQRDGILQVLKTCTFWIRFVSIPNGMEFYKSIVGNKLGKNEFQFPTGWNSTKFPLEIVRNFLVSIPNGMEFYLRLW